jgi:hypothetical protein
MRRRLVCALGAAFVSGLLAALGAAYLGDDLRRAIVFSGFGLC